jgi:hypothetical protein
MNADKHVLAVAAESGREDKPQIRRGKLMRLHRKLKLSTRFRLAKLESAILSPGLAAFVGLGIFGLVWQYGETGFDIAPPVWLMIQFWWALMGGSFAVAIYRNGDNDAGILKGLLEDDLHVGELRDEDLARQIRLVVGYRTALETTLRAGGRDNPPYIAGTLARLDDWLSGLGRLARRVDHFRTETAFQAGQIFDLRQRIADLDARVAEATDMKLIGQLRETIAGRRHQLRLAEELDGLTERGLLSIEHAVASVGTVCAQLALVSTSEDGLSDGTDLNRNIGTEIEQVDTILAAFERVHGGSVSGWPAIADS